MGKTGQTTSYATGDDGDLEKGVAWPNPRFTDNGDGTVTDNLTGLIWLKNANCFSERMWSEALSDCNGLERGECGLTDGSNAGDWRLPNYKELISLIDAEYIYPALPPGHPFIGGASYWYWTSTSDMNYGGLLALRILFAWCQMEPDNKNSLNYVWPVRGGH